MHNVLLTGITWDHIRGFGPLEASVLPYFKKTGVIVEWHKRSLKDFGDASLERLSKEYDLIIMDHPHCGTASHAGCILPVDSLLNDDELRKVSDSAGPSFTSYNYNNKQWALPIDAACQVSSHREDFFEATDLPKSWNEVFKLAQDIKAKGRYLGMALCPTDCNCSFLTLCAQLGSPFTDGSPTTKSVAIEAIEILKRLFDICYPESRDWNPIGLFNHMSKDDDVIYAPLAFGYTNYSRKSPGKKRLRFGAIPEGRNALLGGAGIAISAYCDSSEEAVRYACWLCNEDYQSNGYVFAGGQPAHNSAWTNKTANELTGNFFLDTRQTIDAAYVRPRNKQWPSFQEQLGEIIHDGLLRELDGNELWNKIMAAYDRYYA